MKVTIQVSENVCFDVNYTGAHANIETKYRNVKALDDIVYWESSGEDLLRRQIIHKLKRLCDNPEEALEKFMNEFNALPLAFENEKIREIEAMEAKKKADAEEAEEAARLKREKERIAAQNRKRTSKGRSLSGIIIESAVRRNLQSNKYDNESTYTPRHEYYNKGTEALIKKIEEMESEGKTYEDTLAWYESECIELPQINDNEYDPETIALVTKYTLMRFVEHGYSCTGDMGTGYRDYQIDTYKHPYAIYFGTHEDKQMYLDVATQHLNKRIERRNTDRIAKGRRVVKLFDLPKYPSEAEYAKMLSDESKLRRVKKTALVDMGGCLDNKIRTRYYDKSKPEYYRNIDILIKSIVDEYKKASPEKKKDVHFSYEYASIGKVMVKKMLRV